jgi:N-acetylglucosaminyl-diphospho-decaprenol L-rhamnosyltransferase
MSLSQREILVSIVSHGHGKHVETLLCDLALPGNHEHVSVVLRLNKPEFTDVFDRNWPFPLQILNNSKAEGFSANHNVNFHQFGNSGNFRFYCVLNPDIRLVAGTMSSLLECVNSNAGVALIAPQVLAPDGRFEMNARPLPSPVEIFQKGVAHFVGYERKDKHTDDWNWFAGMFMLFSVDAFRRVGGFDERYFLYYEDVDICCRLRLAGLGLHICSDVSVVHDAQRASHRDFALFLRHLASVLRFFTSRVYRDCRRLERRSTG